MRMGTGREESELVQQCETGKSAWQWDREKELG